MPARPISETVAANAREDEVIYIATMAMSSARRLGQRDLSEQGRLNAIYNDATKVQARRLLIAAAIHLHPLDALFERQMLGNISSYDLAHADAHEAMAEICERMENAAREEAEECRFYAEEARA